MTVLICDMVESTALASKLDPEELRKVMGVYLDACVKRRDLAWRFHCAIHRRRHRRLFWLSSRAGRRRGTRCARGPGDLGRDVPNLAPLPDVTLHVRTGIATGLVVVGDLLGEGAAREESVVGETPALAARLQALAPPDGVAIAGSTRRLIEGMFELEFLGMCDLKGLPGAETGLARAARSRRPRAASMRDTTPI